MIVLLMLLLLRAGLNSYCAWGSPPLVCKHPAEV